VNEVEGGGGKEIDRGKRVGGRGGGAVGGEEKEVGNGGIARGRRE